MDESDYNDLQLLGALPMELMGDDDDDIGAFAVSRRGMVSRTGLRARGQLRRVLIPKVPGAPEPGGRIQPLGFTPIQFVNAGATTLNTTASPQVPVKGGRFVVDIVRSAGDGGLVTLDSLQVGQRNQLASSQPVAASSFQPTAFGTGVSIDPAGPGITISADFSITASPGVGNTVDVQATIIGLAYS